MTAKRIVLIGLDGVPIDMLRALAGNGTMPHTAELLSRGVLRTMQSSIPEISSVAWSSLITGANPAKHGVFGFTDLFPGTYDLRFPNFSDLQVPPFWTELAGESVVMNVPATYPVRAMKGVHISGFVSIDFERSVHPRDLVPKLREMDYRLDVDSEKAHKSMDLFLADLDRTLAARVEAARYLWDSRDWQLFMLVFTGTDRLLHFLWDAYEDEGHRYHAAFLDHFRVVDQAVGEFAGSATDDDLVVMLSDHGFERLETEVYVNYLLEQEGFLTFRKGAGRDLKNVESSTKAFALDPARIYLNLKGRYPAGGVVRRDADRVLTDLRDLTRSLEIGGRKVIRDVYAKEEIYAGPLLDRAPDLVLVADHGFNLRGTPRAEQLHGRTIFTGKHTQDTAFLLVAGAPRPEAVPARPTVCDVKPLITPASGPGPSSAPPG